MKKNKISILIALLTVVIFFSVAAICNQCGITPTTTDTTVKVDVDKTSAEETATESEATDKETSTVETTDKETTEEATDATEPVEKEAPTISLAIVYGPEYQAADGVCFYRIKATVTGKPKPTISFSKDDSNHSWGVDVAQVNLSDPGNTYDLTATATNSEGSDTDSITITWGCATPGPAEEDVTIVADSSKSGYIVGNNGAYPGNLVYVGDGGNDAPVKGYLTFDISDISDLDNVTINDVSIQISGVTFIGEPWNAGPGMDIKVFYFGNNLDYPDDFVVGGALVKQFATSNSLDDLDFSGSDLKNELQKAVDDGKNLFQLKFGLNGVSTNAYGDVYKFIPSNSKITIVYES
jgi:hypothetical protein